MCETETENVNVSSGGSCWDRGEVRDWNRKLRIEIEKDDFTVEFEDGSSGTWTMVYDEGLHFEVTSPLRTKPWSSAL